MNCLRCGYCCIMLDVIIINPKYVKENINFENEFIHTHKPTGVKCPHLEFINKKANCKIHYYNYNWFNNIPCYSHIQVEAKNSNCRIGEHILQLKNKKLYFLYILNKPQFKM